MHDSPLLMLRLLVAQGFSSSLLVAISATTAEWQCKYWKYGSIKLMSEKTRGRNPRSFVVCAKKGESKKVYLSCAWYGTTTMRPLHYLILLLLLRQVLYIQHKSVSSVGLSWVENNAAGKVMPFPRPPTSNQPPPSHHPVQYSMLAIPFVCVPWANAVLMMRGRNQSTFRDK